MLETDLYAPVKSYLERGGYSVRAEVLGCDVTATRGDDLVVVELKKSANLTLLIQATDRQRITDSVYVAVPAPRPRQRRQWRGVRRVLRMLELGLLIVHFDGARTRVECIFDPGPYQRRKRSRRTRAIVDEIGKRSGDFNVGGSVGKPLVTGYRESAIQIACSLLRIGPASPASIRALGAPAKTGRILLDNHYGWFRRVQRGVYALTEQGRADLSRYPELCARFGFQQ